MYADHIGHTVQSLTSDELLNWAKDGFQMKNKRRSKVTSQTQQPSEFASISVPDIIKGDLEKLKDYREFLSSKGTVFYHEDTARTNINYDDVLKVKDGAVQIDKLCLGCKSLNVEIVAEHPFFKGSLCKICVENLKAALFSITEDGIHTHCAICSSVGEVFVCSKPDCCKVYCFFCIDTLAAEGEKNLIAEKEPWLCFLCDKSKPSIYGIIEARPNWMKCQRISSLFLMNDSTTLQQIPKQKSAMTVLSLFDGIGTGMVVLKMLRIRVKKYYASEVDEDSIRVSKLNHGDEIEQIGSIDKLNSEKLAQLGHIDLLIGGSPCTELSLVNPARKGVYNTDKSGHLFFHFHRVLLTLKNKQNGQLFWMFENTAAMLHNTRNVINSFLECEPVIIDAAWLSAQHRARLFWGNIPGFGKMLFTEANVSLNNCLVPGLKRSANVDKLRTITTQSNSLLQVRLSAKWKHHRWFLYSFS